MDNEEDSKNIHTALGEAVMSLLDSQGALNNHAILNRLEQLAQTAEDEAKAASYWKAKKLFRHMPQSATGQRLTDASSADARIVRMPPHRAGFRRTPVEDDDSH
ncbi:hypothetical protein [Pantoea sp.]|uniref:hypothetical protein n=1 Tax=Pantoea sp. TaxID=69393 RepID=UPI00289D1888|nr:hypothetical protein [Pantoea sp.]